MTEIRSYNISNQVSKRLISIPDTRTIWTLWHVADVSLATIWKYSESNELTRRFFFITRNWWTSAKEKEKKKGEVRAKDRSGWAMWYSVYLNSYNTSYSYRLVPMSEWFQNCNELL